MKYIKYFLPAVVILGVGFTSAQIDNQMMGPNQGGYMMGPQMNYPVGDQMTGPQMMGPQMGGPMIGPNQGPMMGPGFGGPMDGQMMGPGFGGPQMGPNQGFGGPGDGEMGPPPEVRAREEREFKNLKKESKKFEKIVAMFEKQIAQLRSKYNAELPPECGEALATLKDIVSSINTAEEFSDLMDKMMDMGTTMDTMQQCMRTSELIKKAPQAFKQAGNELKRLIKEFDRLKKTAVKANIDASKITEIETLISDLQTSLSKIQEDFKTNPEAIDEFQQEFFPKMGEAWQDIDILRRLVQGIQRVKPFLKSADRELKNITRRIATLQRKDIDVSEVQEILSQLQEKLNEIKVMVNERNYEDLSDEMSVYFELKYELDQKLLELGGGTREEYVPQGFEGFFQPMMQVPQSFQQFMQAPSMGPSSSGRTGVNPVGESNPQPLPGPTMPSGSQFIERLTPQDKNALRANIIYLIQGLLQKR